MLRSLMAVERLVISDAAAFELYGYDIMVDEQLKPWLIEVLACYGLERTVDTTITVSAQATTITKSTVSWRCHSLHETDTVLSSETHMAAVRAGDEYLAAVRSRCISVINFLMAL
jgi:tubulin polyglutamylase TTLL9